TLLSAVLAGGAFAAFLSTASGLTVSVAGVIDQDFLARTFGGRFGGDVPRIRTFRMAAVVAVVVPYAMSWLAVNTSLADTVGLAFAVAASTFCPLLVLGVWWRRLSVAGATAGLVTGGVLALSATTVTVLGGAGAVGGGWLGALVAQPAAWTVPTAFAVAVLVSYATPGSIPSGTARAMVRLHAPESLRVTAGPADQASSSR
nr:cation acetate symporter [Actinomycetota bacterium]